jgi:predicted DNA-binding protein with PD1-like motif
MTLSKKLRAASLAALWLTVLLQAVAACAQEAKLPKVFGGAQIAEIYRVRLDRDDLLLESILDLIQKNHIQDGAILTAAGSLQECTFHGVVTLAAKPEQKFTTVREAMEILSISGLIADGEPHFHMTLSNPKGAFGGHLEKGCRVLYRAELTIAKFSGVALARKPNEQGVPVLQRK